MGIACDRFYGHFTLITTEERAICVAINFCYLICNQFSFALLQQQQDTHAAANIAIRETQGERESVRGKKRNTQEIMIYLRAPCPTLL